MSSVGVNASYYSVQALLTCIWSCLAYIINLATQALLRAHSQSKEYNPKYPEAELIMAHSGQHDEIGMIWSICVKEHSSAKCKQLFQTIQQWDLPNHLPQQHPLQLILDMLVRWSSTYMMLDHAEKLKDDVGTFIHEIAGAEKDWVKHQKLQDLQLTDEEWGRISLLLGLLAKVEYTQQSFASDTGPATHLALPALESLHKAWHTQSMKAEYADFWSALEAGVNKIANYYEKTADSDAYIMAMCTLS